MVTVPKRDYKLDNSRIRIDNNFVKELVEPKLSKLVKTKLSMGAVNSRIGFLQYSRGEDIISTDPVITIDIRSFDKYHNILLLEDFYINKGCDTFEVESFILKTVEFIAAINNYSIVLYQTDMRKKTINRVLSNLAWDSLLAYKSNQSTGGGFELCSKSVVPLSPDADEILSYYKV